MAQRGNNKGGVSVIVILLVILLAFLGYGWWSGSFNKFLSHQPSVTQSVQKTSKGTDDAAVSKGKDAAQQGTIKDSKDEDTKDHKSMADKDNKPDGEKYVPGEVNAVQPRPAANVAKGHARMAIVLDDFGYSMNVVKYFNALPIKLTYSVFPHKQYTSAVANSGYAAGKQIMLHLPMESISNVSPEKVTIRTWMGDGQIKKIAASAIASVPHVIGVNNHQGSKASSDARVVRDVASIIKANGLFFLDSRTSARSQIFAVARSMGIPTGQNDLFIDNDNSISAIKARLRQAANIALHDSSKTVIVIGHDRPNTYLAIKEMYRQLQAEGIEFVFVSSLMY